MQYLTVLSCVWFKTLATKSKAVKLNVVRISVISSALTWRICLAVITH
jgi:hypothetical protein